MGSWQREIAGQKGKIVVGRKVEKHEKVMKRAKQ